MLPKEWQSISLQKIQHREDAPLLMGCPSCRHFGKQCSGLNLDLGVFDCQEFCTCKNPKSCDVVCEAAPERYVRSVREIGGFGLKGLNLAGVPCWPVSDVYVPIIDKPLPGLSASDLRIASLPIRSAIKRTQQGLSAYTREQLSARYSGEPETGWLLTGVDHDARIEPIWAIGRAARKELFAELKEAGIRAATSPNFSAIADVPRTDNFHARKRIVICWEELNESGIPTALHVNGRTQGDFDYFADVLRQSGGDSVAFEFATGAAALEAGTRFVNRLQRLVERVGKPLTLVTRGGIPHYPRLLPLFRSVIQVDSTAHIKAKYRQVLRRGGPRGFRWVSQPSSSSLGALLLQAIEHSRWVDLYHRQSSPSVRSPRTSLRIGEAAQTSANDETSQLRLLFDV